MKRSTKHLSLKRETLRTLKQTEIGRAVGGADPAAAGSQIEVCTSNTHTYSAPQG